MNEGVQFLLLCWPAVVLIRELLCTCRTELLCTCMTELYMYA